MNSTTITTTRANGTRRTRLDFSKCVSRVEPEHAKSTDINNIVKGPVPRPSQLAYGDLTNVPDLHHAFGIVTAARAHFDALPADVRSLIGNDPSKLSLLVNKPEYQALLQANGMVKAKPLPEVPVSPKPDPAPESPTK